MLHDVTAAQLDKVREYVRAGHNRVWLNRKAFTLRSKPLKVIAGELGMRPDVAWQAMMACGWYQAATDAERAREVE